MFHTPDVSTRGRIVLTIIYSCICLELYLLLDSVTLSQGAILFIQLLYAP